MDEKKEKERVNGNGATDVEQPNESQEPGRARISGEPTKPDGRGGSIPTPGSSGSGHGPWKKEQNE